LTSFPEEQVYAREPRRRGAVLVIGAGAVGGYLAVALARLGISPLRLVDRDVLSVENLIRHPLGAPDVGQPKAPALARRIRTDFPNCNAFGEDLDFMVLDEPQQLAVLSQASVIVAATDSIDCQRRINELCVPNQIAALYPGIWAADDIRDGEVGALLHVIPGEGTPCYQCYTSWRPQVGGTESRGGSGADLEQFALFVAWAVVSLFDPDDPHADVFDPERTLTLIHNHSSPSPSIAHLFRSGNTLNLRVPFPRTQCPVCGRQATPEVRAAPPPPPPVVIPQSRPRSIQIDPVGPTAEDERRRRAQIIWISASVAACALILVIAVSWSALRHAPSSTAASQAITPSVSASQAEPSPTSSSPQSISPTQTQLICNISLTSSYANDGSDCTSGNLYTGDDIVLEVSGFTQQVVGALCQRGYHDEWTSRGDPWSDYSNSQEYGGATGMCIELSDGMGFDPDGNLVASFSDPDELGTDTVTWHLISPSGKVALAASYSFQVLETNTYQLPTPPS
jgi:molybdopterin/thiamine biosynthesis adenylyltransferase